MSSGKKSMIGRSDFLPIDNEKDREVIDNFKLGDKSL
jgi:hypothetical protein